MSDAADAPSAFDDLLAQVAGPMLIVTTAIGRQRAGCLVGFATQTSIAPRRTLVCLSKENHTTRIAARALWLGVHVLREGDLPLASLFGEHTANEAVDKFAQCGWRPGPGGTPVLHGLDCFVGRIMMRIPYLGDHIGHLLAVDPANAVIDPDRAARRPLDARAVAGLEPGNPAPPPEAP